MSTVVKKFDAEVGKVLHLMIHSIYTNKEICLRELVSNASDACDKLRYLSQQNQDLLQDDSELKILISIDKKNRSLIIEDNGIGMDNDDLSENLGTIARSGTQNFVDNLSGDTKRDSLLIGQFGVGFYSSYMIADSVTVISTKAGLGQSYKWSSKGDGEYTIEDYNQDDAPKRGTLIILNIKESEGDFLDHFRVKNIVKNYSDHISVPILFKDESGNANKINSSSALWTKRKNDITEEEYQNFYKSISYATDKPWLIMHNKNEGMTEFTNLLFVPSEKTFDLFHPDRTRRVKLYIKRVFISDENIDIVPHYLRFLRGVVDSSDLPLNISRETLQHNTIVSKIKSLITKRVLSELKKKRDEKRTEYEVFWQNFGAALKEGLCDANEDHEKILETCIFYSCIQDKMVSLEEYTNSMNKEQNLIYYLSGENLEQLKQSPQIEWFISNNIDVLLLTDHVDDFWCNVVSKYKDYEMRSVTRDDSKDKNKEVKTDEDKSDSESTKTLVEYFKSVLKDLVRDVKMSTKLTESPVRLVVAENAMNMRMERFLVEQKQLHAASAKILEINPNHPIILNIQNNMNSTNEDIVKILFDQACLIEGEDIKDPVGFCKMINRFIAA